MAGPLHGIRGLLLDIDGTLLDADRAVAGAPQAIARLRNAGLTLRFTTNTTRRPRAATAEALRAAGFVLATSEVLGPAALARMRIVESGRPAAAFLLPAAARADFEGVREDEAAPPWVVIGDLGREFTWDRLNRAFHWIRDGARLLALHRNRYWDNGTDGIVLDVGPFVAALEEATGTTAELVGKPAPAFFHLAMKDAGLRPEETLVVGDDLEADIAGGRAAGCRAALVLTGRAGASALAGAAVRPDAILDSIAALAP